MHSRNDNDHNDDHNNDHFIIMIIMITMITMIITIYGRSKMAVTRRRSKLGWRKAHQSKALVEL